MQTINQAESFAAGDQVLCAVAHRLGECLPEGALLARGPGDDFIIVVATDPHATVPLAERLLDAVRAPLQIGDLALEPTVSIGIADAAADTEPEDALRQASVALQRAKAHGRNRFEFSDAAVAAAAQERLRVSAAIRDALRGGQITCWYQPIVDLGTGAVVGHEALVRAPGTPLGEPGDFLPVAETSDLVVDIDLAVLAQAARELTGLPPDVFVSVNASARSIGDPRYVQSVEQWLGDFPELAGRLHIEATETANFSITDDVRAIVTRLAAAGVRWFADDFGTGYSSIAHLRDLPIAGLKLDRSFTEALTDRDGTAERLSRAMAALANGMQLESVAEGVETREQADTLRALGWRWAQGWLFGRATPHPVGGGLSATAR